MPARHASLEAGEHVATEPQRHLILIRGGRALKSSTAPPALSLAALETTGFHPFYGDDVSTYLEHAHGLLGFITTVIDEAGRVSNLPMADELTRSALASVETLMSLGLYHLAVKQAAVTIVS